MRLLPVKWDVGDKDKCKNLYSVSVAIAHNINILYARSISLTQACISLWKFSGTYT